MTFPHLGTVTPYEDLVTDVLAEDQIHHAIFGAFQRYSALPSAITGSATSWANGQTLVASGATFVASGVVVGDVIYNSTDASYAIVKSVDSATQLTTTPLKWGITNAWASTNTFAIRAVPYRAIMLTAVDGSNGIGIYVRDSGNTAWTYMGSSSSGGSSLWTAVTGTRTGNTTFTVAGDVTATLAPFTPIAWKESTVQKGGFVVSSSYSSPNTTVTIVGDTMASIDASSLKWTFVPLVEIKAVVAGAIGATQTGCANTYTAKEALRIYAADIDTTTAWTTNSTTVDINKNGTTMFTTKPTMASGVAQSVNPFTADNGTSLARGNQVKFDIDAVQTTPADELYITVYGFRTAILNQA